MATLEDLQKKFEGMSMFDLLAFVRRAREERSESKSRTIAEGRSPKKRKKDKLQDLSPEEAAELLKLLGAGGNNE